MSFRKLKQRCYETNMMLSEMGLVFCTFGNVSCADREAGVFAIKPSGVEYSKLQADQIVVLDFNGRIIEGAARPSSDTPTHVALYTNFPELGGIVHTHSTYATAWAQSCRDIPLYGTTHADHLSVAVPCTELMPDECVEKNYEMETGVQIIECLRQRRLDAGRVEMILVGGHGPFTWGTDAVKAVYNARVLEEIAKMAAVTAMLNPQIASLKQAIVNKHYARKHGKDAYYGQA